LGHLKSEVDNPQFFFAQDGAKNPANELQASVQAFKKEPKLQCTFPARFQFLNQKLTLKLPTVPCIELDEFLRRLSGDAMSLVFSSAYPNSPPSMFGHTFLRIHRNGREVLLDESINYAAQASPDENTILFTVFGLMGGYYGGFGISPYYMKVNEYAYAESRDLWEYDLSLTKSEIETFLKHVWELNQKGQFKYFFFDENCSYRILTLLEVARPDWVLSEFSIHVIPAETVKKVLNTPGAITDIHYRPSLFSQMEAKWAILNPEEETQTWNLIQTPSSEALPPRILDAALSYFQYKKLQNKNVLVGKDQERFADLLMARSKLGVATESAAVIEIPDRPDQGHPPYKWSLGVGALNSRSKNGEGHSGGFQEFQFKFAYHDLLNEDRGYIPFSQIDFPTLNLRYSDALNSLWIERLSLFSVTALSPWTSFARSLSWKVDVAYISPKDYGCVDCHAAMIEGGAGVAGSLFSNQARAYGLVLAHVEAGSSIENTVRFLPQVQVGFLAQVVSHYKVQATLTRTQDVFQNARRKFFYTAEFNQSWAIRPEWEIRLMSRALRSKPSQKADAYLEASLSLNHYY